MIDILETPEDKHVAMLFAHVCCLNADHLKSKSFF